MENKNEYQAQLFSNRLKKKYKELRKWARKNRISCYRLYDRDIPEIPVSLDLYEFLPSDVTTPLEVARFLSEQNANLSSNNPQTEQDIKQRTYAILYLYERPYQKEDSEEELWLSLMAQAAADVLGIPLQNIISKMRRHQKGKSQYEKNEDSRIKYENDKIKQTMSSSGLTRGSLPQKSSPDITGLVQEQGQIFKINLGTYLDNGLFFDHRPLRSIVRDTCSNKDVLNLFCYTGSFSVYAAQGNAKSVESVDLSNTYLAWAKENLIQNGFSDKKKYIFTRQDCIQFLQEKALAQKAKLNEEKNPESNPRITSSQNKDLISKAKTYDLIILDPPTFSNSKNTANVLDINKQWPQLVKDCLNILNPKGVLYFSTNSERLKFDQTQIPPKTISGLSVNVQDITNQTIPNDYAQKIPHHCWKFWVE
jgi:23S rRNA (cytosine1962-C5)-methyltransferase